MENNVVMNNQDKIFEILFDKNEITWQNILYDLVRTEQMDPWDVDISSLTARYIEIIKKLKEMDFALSGKVLLAAAILLKIKSNRLVGEDLNQLDRLFAMGEEETEEGLYEDVVEPSALFEEKPSLIPRTPQPRKRKVSIYDLMNALEQALEVKKRRVMRSIPSNIEIPAKTKDITSVIKETFFKIRTFFLRNSSSRLTFSKLLPSDSKQDKVYTFIPLLHLSTHPQRKIDLMQQKHFGEIEIMLLQTKQEVDKELSQDST